MIELKISNRELNHLSRFFQTCINIAREEIQKRADYQLYLLDKKNYAIKEVSWPVNSTKTALSIAERHANISEFEAAQLKCINAYARKTKRKQKSVSLSPTMGFLYLNYMPRSEAIEKDAQVNLTIQIHASTILKNLL